MSAKRYTEEFKIEASKQVTERNYKLNEVASPLGISEPTLRIQNSYAGCFER